MTNTRLWRLMRPGAILVFDTTMAAVSFYASLWLRLGDDPMTYSPDLAIYGTTVFTAIAAIVFILMRAHREVWRYTSMAELLAILRMVTIIVVAFVVVLFLVTRLEKMPRSSLAINWLVLTALLTGPRVLYRRIKDRSAGAMTPRPDPERIPVLLIGAGDGADMFIRTLSLDPGARYQAVGIIDPKGARVGRRLRGIGILGRIDDVETVVAGLDRNGLRPRRLIITDSEISGAATTDLLARAEALGMSLSRLPRITDFQTADAARIEPRPIAIEDLLGRAQRVLDRDAMERLIRGRRVLVTGAGGTIGSELARQIAALGPATLSLLDHTEYALYSIDLEIGESVPELAREAVLGDVRDRERIAATIARLRPELVFHAAALKHVPIVETHPEEGVLTNIAGTRNVADACLASGVETMVLISTDKAVNPQAVMGASKRVAESYCQALNVAREGGAEVGDTRFITVRFGNVLGSTGSVVPLFQRQLAQGGPLTVTHPNITRYFMTLREAVELVLEASALGAGAQQGAVIYVLDMGEPVRIMDLATQMIRLAGLRPGIDIPIKITGLRPGEKMTEQLFHDAETTEPTRYPGVLVAQPRALALAELVHGIDEITAAAAGGAPDRVRDILARLVPEYAPATDHPVRQAAN